MFNWFKKPKPQIIVATQQSGYFSTDIDLRAKRPNLSLALKQTFQKTDKDFHILMPDGTTAAMDESNLSDTKLFASFGQNIPEAQFLWYASQGFIGHQACAMLAQNWLVDKACSMPARDAVRHGWEITVNDGSDIDPKTLDEIRRLDKLFRTKHNAEQFVRMGRIFGIRIAMFKVESRDPQYYEKPFNIDGITKGSYKGISQIDPYWCAPELRQDAASDPSAIDFYEPTWWRINGKRVHKSHLIIMRNGEVPDVLKPSYLYGGVPVPQRIAERVYAAERTANEAPLLAMTKRTNAVHTDVEKAMANQDIFEERMNQWIQYRDNYGVKVLGTEEQMEQFDTTLSDLDAVIMTQYQIVAAAAGVPATKLLGTAPKGFNATGEFEESSYHEELESIQESDITPLLERHYAILIRSHLSKQFEATVHWNPVDSQTAAEQAETNLKKAQTDSALAQAGAIDGYDIRQRLITDKGSGYTGMSATVPEGPGDEGDDEASDDS